MADSLLQVFSATGGTAAIDIRTESTNGDGRQVITIGDPTSNNAVASVQATDPSSNTEGVVVRDVNTSAIVARIGQTIFVQFDPGHTLGSISGIGSSIAVYFDRANPNVTANAGTGSFTVQFDPGHTLGIVGDQSTLVTPISASGSTSGVSASGTTIAGPTSGRVIKVFAYNLSTTAQSHVVVKFTNGAGTSPTEFRRYALQAPTQGIAGANLAVTPPGYLFATPSGSTLSIVLDTASLVHYSISYFEESA